MPDERPGLAIVVRGPAEPITLRKKGRVAGIWINTDSVRFDTAPGFYAVATSAPIKTLVDERNASIWEIGLDYLQLSPTTGDTAQIAEFTRGLIDLRRRSGLWSEQEGRIGLTQNILYQARIAIPSAVPVGVVHRRDLPDPPRQGHRPVGDADHDRQERLRTLGLCRRAERRPRLWHRGRRAGVAGRLGGGAGRPANVTGPAPPQ